VVGISPEKKHPDFLEPMTSGLVEGKLYRKLQKTMVFPIKSRAFL
jgi:hypothetical protein